MSIFLTKILVATDGSEEADLALHTATDLAKYTGSELHLVYVEAPSYVSPTADWETLGADYLPNRLNEAPMAAAKSQVDRQVQRVRGGGGEIAGAQAREGFPDAEIVDLAEELGAGLIVMGSRGHGGVRRALMGSVSDSVVRHAHCPVLVVRPRNNAWGLLRRSRCNVVGCWALARARSSPRCRKYAREDPRRRRARKPRGTLANSVTQKVIGLVWKREIGGSLPLLSIRSAMLRDVIDCKRGGRRTEGQVCGF